MEDVQAYSGNMSARPCVLCKEMQKEIYGGYRDVEAADYGVYYRQK